MRKISTIKICFEYYIFKIMATARNGKNIDMLGMECPILFYGVLL